MKSNDFLSEGFVEDANDVHLDHEVQMARADCFHAAEDALILHKLLRNVDEYQGLEGWVASKITLAADYLKTVREYLEYEMMSGHLSPAAEQPVMPIAEGNDYWDKDKRDFKRREHEAEWEIEKRLSQKRAEQEAGTWYIRINGKIFKDKATGEPAKFNGKKHANAVAVKMMQKPFNQGKEFMLTTSPTDKEQGVAEEAKWRKHRDAYDVDDEGNKTPRNPNSPQFGYDPLQRRADTAGDAKTPRGKKAALKTSLKMAKGTHGPKGVLPEQGVAEGLAKGQAAWKKEMTAKGAVSVKRDRHGDGAVDRIIAYDKNGEVVGGFNRKGVVEDDRTPGYIKYEQMKDKIASVLIKLYDQGNDEETIKQMSSRVARHLGYNPEDPIYQDAWMSSFTDASLDGSLDREPEDDYTDYTMRQGEMGQKGVAEGADALDKGKDSLNHFGNRLKKAVKSRAAEISANTAIMKAQDPNTWQWAVGDQVYSKKTGKTYTITGITVNRKGQPMYDYQRGDRDSLDYEKGQFIADLAHNSLTKINEDSATESDISGILGAARLVNDYIITAEVDGVVKKFRVRGMTGPRAATENFLKRASEAKILDVEKDEPKGNVKEGRWSHSVKTKTGTKLHPYTGAELPGKPPKGTSTASLKQLEKNKREKPGQSPFKTQDEKVSKYLGTDVAEGQVNETSAGSVAGVVNPPAKNKAKVGTLFGGTYKQKKTKAK